MPTTKKKRRPPPPRGITPTYPTGAAELADIDRFPRFHVGFHPQLPAHTAGPMGIRQRRDPEYFDARPGMSKSALYAEVARLNAGLPVEPKSQGIGRRTAVLKAPARWVEFLLDFDETRAVLRDALHTGRKLSLNDVHGLMTHRNSATGVDLTKYKWLGAPNTVTFESLTPEQRRLIMAVAKQLQRVLGERLVDTRNDWRAIKR